MRPSIWLALGLTFVAPVYAQAPQLALKMRRMYPSNLYS